MERRLNVFFRENWFFLSLPFAFVGSGVWNAGLLPWTVCALVWLFFSLLFRRIWLRVLAFSVLVGLVLGAVYSGLLTHLVDPARVLEWRLKTEGLCGLVTDVREAGSARRCEALVRGGWRLMFYTRNELTGGELVRVRGFGEVEGSRVRIVKGAKIEVLGRIPVLALPVALRNELRERTSLLPPVHRTALFFALGGKVVDVPRETYDRVTSAGVVHLGVVSGFHVGVVLTLVLLLLYFIFGEEVPPWARSISFVLASVAVCVVALVLGDVPALRGAFMGVSLLFSLFYRRFVSPLNALSWVFCLFLLPCPLLLHDPGFQLSFFVTAVLVLFAPLLAKMGGLMGTFFAGVLASVASFPFLSFHFATFSAMSPISTFFLSPVVVVTFPLALCAVVFPQLLPLLVPISEYYNRVLEVCSRFGGVERVVSLPLWLCVFLPVFMLAMGVVWRIFEPGRSTKAAVSVLLVLAVLVFRFLPQPSCCLADGFMFAKAGGERVFVVWGPSSFWRVLRKDPDVVVVYDARWPVPFSERKCLFVLPTVERGDWEWMVNTGRALVADKVVLKGNNWGVTLRREGSLYQGYLFAEKDFRWFEGLLRIVKPGEVR